MTNFRGQILKETVTLLTGPDTPPIRYEIRRTYTAFGQHASVHLVSAEGETLSLDHKVNYAWNQHGQLASVKSLAGEFDYEYNEANPALLAKMTGPVHEVETTYEPHRNLITGVTNFAKRGGAGSTLPADGGGAVLSSYAYSNDLLGRRETISQGGEAFAMLKLGETKVYVAYNDRSEVVGATYKTGNETRHEFAYVYDGIGNRREAAESRATGQGSRVETTKTTYQTNALNQYQEISENQRKSAVRPIRDLDGNLVEDDKNRYTWDSDNRLVRVESKTGDLRIEYLHDYQSRRTVRIETKNPGKENEEQRTTCYLYDDWNLLAELDFPLSPPPSVPPSQDPSPDPSVSPSREKSPVRFFTWGRDLSGSLQGAGGVGGLLAISEGESHRFPAYDANGNVSQLVDESGAITAAYTYDPFGSVTDMAGLEAEGNPWRFSTKPVDFGTGWIYYGYRYYDTETGRWPNRDPIGERGGVNLYGFVGNDGVGVIDYLGKMGRRSYQGHLIHHEVGQGQYPVNLSPEAAAFRLKYSRNKNVTYNEALKELEACEISDIYVYTGHGGHVGGNPALAVTGKPGSGAPDDAIPVSWEELGFTGPYTNNGVALSIGTIASSIKNGSGACMVIILGCAVTAAELQPLIAAGAKVAIASGGTGDAGYSERHAKTILQTLARGGTVGEALRAVNEEVRKENEGLGGIVPPQTECPN